MKRLSAWAIQIWKKTLYGMAKYEFLSALFPRNFALLWSPLKLLLLNKNSENEKYTQVLHHEWNRPFQSLFQSEAKNEAVQVFIFTRKVLLVASFKKWEVLELGWPIPLKKFLRPAGHVWQYWSLGIWPSPPTVSISYLLTDSFNSERSLHYIRCVINCEILRQRGLHLKSKQSPAKSFG